MILVLQTNIAGSLYAWFIRQGKITVQKKMTVQWHGSERLLPMIDGLLQLKKLRLNDIERIIVVRGPGPFTAVRSGIVTANTLGWLLNVPVQGLISEVMLSSEYVQEVSERKIAKKFTAVKPAYGREPNISKPKKKALR